MLVLSQFYEEPYALDLIGDRAEGVGYLLKARVGDIARSSTPSSGWRPAAARSIPEVVSRMLGRRRATRSTA